MTPSEMDEAVYDALLKSGMPGTKNAWPFGKAPTLPWFVYKRQRGGEVFADDSNWARMARYQVDLYEAEAGEGVSDALEEAMNPIGPHAMDEQWIPVEGAWLTSYTLTFHPTE